MRIHQSLWFFGLFLLIGFGASAQQVSEKQDLSLFRLNYSGAPVYKPQNVKITAHYGDVDMLAYV